MYKVILEIDSMVIINYIIEVIKNQYRISILVKEALLNCIEAILKHLVFIYDYFSNSRLNSKKIYLKFRILNNKDIDKSILVVRDSIIEIKFYKKNNYYIIMIQSVLDSYTDIPIKLIKWYIKSILNKRLLMPQRKWST